MRSGEPSRCNCASTCAGPAGRAGAQAVETERDRDRYTRTLLHWFALAREQSLGPLCPLLVHGGSPFKYERLVRYDVCGVPCCLIRNNSSYFLRSYTRSISSRGIGCSRTSSFWWPATCFTLGQLPDISCSLSFTRWRLSELQSALIVRPRHFGAGSI